MKQGKIAENVLKRSVLKPIQSHTEKKANGAVTGSDCAFLAYKMQTISLPVAGDVLMRHGIYAAVNALAAEGYMPQNILLGISIPERMREIRLKTMMEAAQDVCMQENLQILGGHTEVSDAVSTPVLSVTATGTGAAPAEKKAAGLDIVVTKYIGMEAAALLAQEKEAQLLARFPKVMVEKAKGFEKYLSILPEAATAGKSGVSFMQAVREGGIFASLWELAERAGVGLHIDLMKIPMDQTVVEICNYYDLNPYEILSSGSALLFAKQGQQLCEELEEIGIPAAVIGQTTDGNDRIIQNGEEIRYLDLPKPDQIRKILNYTAKMASKGE